MASARGLRGGSVSGLSWIPHRPRHSLLCGCTPTPLGLVQFPVMLALLAPDTVDQFLGFSVRAVATVPTTRAYRLCCIHHAVDRDPRRALAGREPAGAHGRATRHTTSTCTNRLTRDGQMED